MDKILDALANRISQMNLDLDTKSRKELEADFTTLLHACTVLASYINSIPTVELDRAEIPEDVVKFYEGV